MVVSETGKFRRAEISSTPLPKMHSREARKLGAPAIATDTA